MICGQNFQFFKFFRRFLNLLLDERRWNWLTLALRSSQMASKFEKSNEIRPKAKNRIHEQ